MWRLCWKFAINRAEGCDPWESPWLNVCFDDSSQFRDGNPIFSAFSHGRRLGIRIIQLDESWEKEGVKVWQDIGIDGVKTLVMACSLTEPNMLHVFELIKRWIDDPSR